MRYFNPLRDKLFSDCPNSRIFLFFSITCEFNSKFDTKFVLAIIFFEKITLKIAYFPVDLYSKHTSGASKLARNSHTHSSLIYGFAKLPPQHPQQM